MSSKKKTLNAQRSTSNVQVRSSADILYASHLVTELRDLRERSERLQRRFAEIGFAVTGGHLSMSDSHIDSAIESAKHGLKTLRRS